MSAAQEKSDEELIEIISQNSKYPSEYLRGMQTSLPLEELAVMSSRERRNIYMLQLPMFFVATAAPFGMLVVGKLKPRNTTFKILGFSLSGYMIGKCVSYNDLYSHVLKEFPYGGVASVGKTKFLTNIIFKGKNLYGEGWTVDKKHKTLE